MTEIIFSFDTEDFTSNTAADTILEQARALRELGIRGCFCIVGLLARQLKRWDREDIVKELEYHEIGLHSYGHTLHPTINEYTDIDSFADAYSEVVRQESEAVRLIKELTGRSDIYAACPPGNQKNYVAMYAYSDMGIPIYADTLCDCNDGSGAYYCNIYQIRYTLMLESLLFNATEEDMRAALDELAKNKRAVVFTHPNNVLFSEAWDEQFYKYNHNEFDHWVEGKRRPVCDSLRFMENFRKFAKMIRDDGRFKITTYGEVAQRLKAEPRRCVVLSDAPILYESIMKSFYPVSEPVNLSVSDMFLAARDFLLGKEEYVAGKVYGLLYTPYAITEPITLDSEAIRESALNLDGITFIPESVVVGGVKIGPADWLRAALCVLSGQSTVTLVPAQSMPSLDVFPRLKTINFKGGWMQSDEFVDKYISERLRLQSWTMRFPNI